jgi:GT2 family glycosyltransferase
MDLSIIIVNWNSAAYLKACIASVRRETVGIDYEIVVIDSGSFDGCGEMLARTDADVRFIQSPHNLGFGRANNAAVQASRGAALLFLNPDTEVRGTAIATLLDRLHRLPDAGAVGCRLLNTDGTLQTSCVQAYPTIANQVLDAEWLRARSPRSRLWGIDVLFAEDDKPREVETVCGACVMMKRAVFERIDGFSTEYFMYAEDIDLCYKVARAGLKVYHVADATVVHHGSGSSGAAPSNFSIVWMRESICLFLTKERGRAYAAAYRWAMLGAALLRLTALHLRPGRPGRGHDEGARGARRKWQAVLAWRLARQTTMRRFQPVR